ncbi:MAG: DUF3050 domain-containing protein [Saprospiraceae bacterium]|nr:DUF3050 domain-containing protein [Saprospiraceae bacterium]
MDHIRYIEKALMPYRERLINHPLYTTLRDIEDIRTFMESHVYAVWDFMSLLKALQIQFTCVELPWKPKPNPKIARFINEIVWAEESDINEHKEAASHFEMYIASMKEVGADTNKIYQLIESINGLSDIESSLQAHKLSKAEYNFLSFTFETIQTKQAHKIAAAFTFGREDLIPDMFLSILRDSERETQRRYPKLLYYLERHIEIDGDEHGPLALEMIQELCGDSSEKWDDVLALAKNALEKRIELWDGITTKIQSGRRDNSRFGNMVYQ